MEKRNIVNLILTSSIIFFSACSNKTPEAPKVTKKSLSQSLSAYSIIGIDQNEPIPAPIFVATRQPVQAPLLVANNQSPEDNFDIISEEEPEQMEYVETTPPPMTIAMPTPVYENVNSYSQIDETPPIEVISYASNPVNSVENHVTEAPRREYSQNIEVISYGSNRGMTKLASYSPSSSKNSYSPNSSVIKNEIEAKAKSFLGTKYVWGATGPSKFDCSGFTQWVYRDSGIAIPRVSKDQAKVGNYVQYADLRRGDMVFFDTKKHPQGIVTHVGIYLGNHNFIHASSAAKKVVIFNFDEKPYYKKRFLWGRRVINNNYLALK